MALVNGAPKNSGIDPFPDPVSHFGAQWQQFGLSRQCSVAGVVALMAVSESPVRHMAGISLFFALLDVKV